MKHHWSPLDHRIEVVGHGGAGDFFPGNSRRAIEKALEIGVDRIEFDVQRAGDGQLVLVHDDDVRDPSGQRRPVSRLTVDDLRSSLPGLLTFDEAIDLIAGRVPVMIDIKNAGYEREVINAVERHHLADASSASTTHPTTLRRLRAALPTMRLGLSTGHMATGFARRPPRAAMTAILKVVTPPALIPAMALCGVTEVMIHHRICTTRMVSLVHGAGRTVNVWTVDRPQSIRRAIELGVDGIISNRPDLVHEVLAFRGGEGT